MDVFSQAAHSSTISHPSTSSVRKPTVAPVRGRKVQGRTAVTPRLTGISRAAAPVKTQSAVSHGPRHPLRSSFTKSQEKDADTGYSWRLHTKYQVTAQII